MKYFRNVPIPENLTPEALDYMIEQVRLRLGDDTHSVFLCNTIANFYEPDRGSARWREISRNFGYDFLDPLGIYTAGSGFSQRLCPDWIIGGTPNARRLNLLEQIKCQTTSQSI